MLNLNTIYTSYYKKSFLFVKSYVQDEQLAEDIVSEVIIALWKKSETTALDNLESYLMTSLKNRALNYLRKKKQQTELLNLLSEDAQLEMNSRINSLESFEPQQLISKELQENIDNVLNTLPERTRLVFKLSRYEDKNYDEIANTLNITVKGVEYHISKALKVLRNNLKEYHYCFLFFL